MMISRLFAASLVVLGILASPDTRALNFTPVGDGRVIDAQGPIEPGDADKLRTLLRTDQRYRFGGASLSTTLTLHSPGGSVVAGIELANAVRELALMTNVRQGASCYSACTFVFLGGVKRTILGNFGIHAMSKSSKGAIVVYDDNDFAAVQYLVSTLVGLAQNLIGDSRMITQMLIVPSSDIRHVTDPQLAEWRIITQASRPTQRMKASFECTKPGLDPIERTVCDSLVLAESDRRMAVAYSWLIDHKSDGLKSDEIKADQERWVAYRNSCRNVRAPNDAIGLAACVNAAYDVRLKQLEGLMNYHLAGTMPPASEGWKVYEPAADITKRER